MCYFCSSANYIRSVVGIVWTRICYFCLLARAPVLKRILVLFQKCSTCISDRNRIGANSETSSISSLFVTYFRQWISSLEQHFSDVFYFLPAELSSPMPLESDMKKQEHLWQNQSPNFLAEKAFNAAVAALPPHCAVCSLFCPYTKVQKQQRPICDSKVKMAVIEVAVEQVSGSISDVGQSVVRVWDLFSFNEECGLSV